MTNPTVITSHQLRNMSEAALVKQVQHVNIFAEVDPIQKQRVIAALRRSGRVVGYMGDGINDASALHTADVGIAVDGGVDALKEAADIVLLKKDLGVLTDGVVEGRRTFGNTLKYVFMATSANFGNMFSMAGASLFLPFLPLLPKQILFMNFLTDVPEMTIATDSVDEEFLQRPRRWNIAFIRKFMIVFGLISSLFDFLTFYVLIHFLHADVTLFRTGWFVESVISAAIIVLVIRTRRVFFRSRPSRALLISTLGMAVITLLVPLTPLAGLFGFATRLPAFLLVLAVILILYITLAEVAKRVFYWATDF